MGSPPDSHLAILRSTRGRRTAVSSVVSAALLADRLSPSAAARLRTHDAVGGEPPAALEAPDGALGGAAELAVRRRHAQAGAGAA